MAELKNMKKIYFYIFISGICVSIVLITSSRDPNVAYIGEILLVVSILGSIIAIPNDSYPKLLFRKMIMKLNSHKEKIKKELEDK